MPIICAGCGHDLDFHTPRGCSHYGCNCERKRHIHVNHTDSRSIIHSELQAKKEENHGKVADHPLNGGKVLRAAYFDDWIVKTEHGFAVIPFNKTENAIFFIDAFEPSKAQRAFKAWAKKATSE